LNATRLRSDPEQIARGLVLLIPDGSVGEIRIVYPGGKLTFAGWFDDRVAALRAVLEHDGKAIVYCTLNTVDRALISRASNRLERNQKPTTADKEITRRRFILVDLDAIRPAGISSTDAEHDAALALGREVAVWLESRGWDVISADSGNGAHVLVPIDEPNDAATTDMVKGCLRGLAFQFNDERIAVDVSVFNASRITKMYGTIVVKGDNTPERPHRVSRLLP
jgi:hypothetical protein